MGTRVPVFILASCALASTAAAQPGPRVPLPEGTRILRDLAYVPGGFVTIPGGPHGGETVRQGLPLALDFLTAVLKPSPPGGPR